MFNWKYPPCSETVQTSPPGACTRCTALCSANMLRNFWRLAAICLAVFRQHFWCDDWKSWQSSTLTAHLTAEGAKMWESRLQWDTSIMRLGGLVLEIKQGIFRTEDFVELLKHLHNILAFFLYLHCTVVFRSNKCNAIYRDIPIFIIAILLSSMWMLLLDVRYMHSI